VRLFVTRDPQEACDGIIWVNPTIEVIDDTIASDIEGCLSLPEIDVTVRRPVGVRICGHDLDGNVIEEESSEHIARVWQHEYDHLDGRLITDRMSTMDRIRSRRALRTLLQRDS
jgi:peptide deformylase